ncbi:MAG: hypothetical protein QW201_01600 [Thermoproteota archaeon]|nr:hypothetical protein [Candidatus Bathyarchaeota archaeon]
MTRRRRREVKVFRKQIPKIFYCPKCGIQAVSVNFDKKGNQVVVSCGNCLIRSSFTLSKPMAPVDAYNKFVDEVLEKVVSG